MKFEAFVALRYLRGKRKNRFVSLITLISVAGVSVGVMALIVVMSVMTGFDIELRKTIIGNRAHLTVHNYDRQSILDAETAISKIKALCPEIQACSPVIETEALLEFKSPYSGTMMTGAYIIGVDPKLHSEVTQLAESVTPNNGRSYGYGELPGEKEILLGYLLADHLGRPTVGDRVAALTSRGNVTPFGRRDGQKILLAVSGLAQFQMPDFDQIYAYVDLPTARMLTGREGVDSIQCRLDSPFHASAVGQRIQKELGFRTITWYESQREFFQALSNEKLIMFIILAFIILVAAFNITSTLLMVVMEKRRDIGILRTLGTSGAAVMRVFVLEGLLIGMSGALLGFALGLLLAYNLNPVVDLIARLVGTEAFPQEIYYFDRIPVSVVWLDVMWITLSSIVLTFLSTLYPAWSASRLDPVEALRYE